MLRRLPIASLSLLALSCGDRPRHPHPDEALRDLSAALRRATEEERYDQLADAIADLFVEAPCAAAIRITDDAVVDARSARIARACAPSYCPSLDDPKPALCAPGALSRNDHDVASGWPALRRRALERDLGEPRGERAAEVVEALDDTIFVPISIPLPVAPPAPTRADGEANVTQLVLARREGATWLRVEGGEEHVLGHGDAAAAEIARHLPAPEGEARAVIAADRDVPYDDVVLVVAALRRVGYEDYVLAGAPPEP
ncbi:MAG: ExbD/TolR family protein [Sandaracinaceae bacterium]